MECFICGAKGEKLRLYEAIIKNGLVKICENCSVKESIPILKGIKDLKLKESERNLTVYERLSKMAGLDPEKHKEKFGKGSEILERQNEELRKVVERKQKLAFPALRYAAVREKEDLVRNYHWLIFTTRRARRITQLKLAEAIGESEASIKLVERGILPDNYHPFINKLQTYLGVTLLTKPVKKQLNFDKFSSKQLTLNDIKKFEREKDAESSKGFFPYWREKIGIFQKKREERIENERKLASKNEDSDANTEQF